MDYVAIVVLNILYMVAFLALISVGLAIIFGMMRVINLAHGEFIVLGGYITIAASWIGINVYIAMLVISPIVVGLVGFMVERLIIRHLYGRMIDSLLATWGLSLLLIGVITLIFGTSAVSIPVPIPGLEVGDYQTGGYNLFIMAVSIVLVLAFWLVLRFTRIGLITRGAMQGADVVAALGHNPRNIYTFTFTVGAALSGLAGGVLAPLIGLLPSVGVLYIAKAFITVITGGSTVIAGTLSASFLFGTISQLVSFAFTPMMGEISMLVLALALLRLMPQGITGRFFRNSM